MMCVVRPYLQPPALLLPPDPASGRSSVGQCTVRQLPSQPAWALAEDRRCQEAPLVLKLYPLGLGRRDSRVRQHLGPALGPSSHSRPQTLSCGSQSHLRCDGWDQQCPHPALKEWGQVVRTMRTACFIKFTFHEQTGQVGPSGPSCAGN